MLFCALRLRSEVRKARRSRWKRRIVWALGITAACLIVIYLIVRQALRYEPTFYTEALHVDRTVQRDAADLMTKQTAALVSDVQKVGRWQARFTEAQINGWLATELGQEHPEYLPTFLREPRVRIAPEGITLAARYQDGARNVVVSLVADLYLADENVVGLRVRKARAGALPFPLEGVIQEISRATSQSEWQVRWRRAGGDPVAEITVPEAPQRRDRAVTVDTVQLGHGEIILGGTTKRR